MKIAIVIERLEAWRGGQETSTLELAHLLSAHDHDMHVVTSTSSGSSNGLKIHVVHGASMLAPRRTAVFIKQATTFLRQHEFDATLAISPCPSCDVYQPRGGLLPETIERNVAMRKSASRRLLKRALMAMNVKQRSLLELERRIMGPEGPTILAVSEYVARQCEQHYGLTAPRVRVVFNGVSAPAISEQEQAANRASIREQYQIPDGALLLLFVAHNFRLKGLGPLIDTVSRLATGGFKDFRLLVVGRDNPVPYQRRLEASKLERYVVFTGPTQRSTTFLHAADVCVHPTYYDPCSRVVLEALSYGVPCITTSFNGAAEIMTDGREGFIIRGPEEVGLMARRIEELANDDLRRKMGERARALRSRISMERHVRELNDVLHEVATDKRRSRIA